MIIVFLVASNKHLFRHRRSHNGILLLDYAKTVRVVVVAVVEVVDAVKNLAVTFASQGMAIVPSFAAVIFKPVALSWMRHKRSY
ncbi:uncharacterized protein N7477_005342 [Penicillium maclennaniae]|uniref:uncharacterized protein n=1 Tax=Penicillium maclennaniae TaxID=1343394 RepID=UPI0025426463|nr:uncharacterized protein N7477_005342 [Penicillium maclennaniae]KAJ5669979.1 hypothetical protein N7477_005342 [Penicillium maclennaniae]